MEPVIAGHPLHPSLIPVPVGTLPASFVLDVLAMATDSDTLAEAAFYNMVIGAVGAVPAAITGFLDYRQMASNDPAHQTATTHGLANGGIIGLYLLNLLVRRNNKRSKLGFALSAIGTAALMGSAYLGGEIAYGRGWRVRSAERFELEWQKEHQTGPFAPKDHQGQESTETAYPPAVLKGFREKKSGEAVMKEIQAEGTANGSSEATTKPAIGATRLTPPTPLTHPANGNGAANGNGGSKFSQPSASLSPDDRPSQAEGERDEDRSTSDASRIPAPEGRPSQAEGERTTIDADLNQ